MPASQRLPLPASRTGRALVSQHTGASSEVRVAGIPPHARARKMLQRGWAELPSLSSRCMRSMRPSAMV